MSAAVVSNSQEGGLTTPQRPSSTNDDHIAIREKYFAAVVGRSPAPPRASFPEVTPRKGGVIGRRATGTDDAMQDTINGNAAFKSQILQETNTILSSAEGIVSFLANKAEKFPGLSRRLTDACNGFDEGFKWVLPGGYTLGSVQQDGLVSLSSEQIQAILKLPRHLSLSELQQVLGDLSSTEKLARVTQHDIQLQVASLDPHCRSAAAGAALSKRSSSSSPASSPSSPAAAPVAIKTANNDVSEVVIGMYNFLHMDVQNHALDELKKTDADRDRLWAQLQQSKKDLDACLDDGRLVDAEEAHKEVLNAYVRYIELLAQRAELMQMTNTDAGVFKDQLDELHREADQVRAAYRKDKSNALDDIEKDIVRVKDARKKQAVKEETAVTRYETSEGNFSVNMKQNEREQMRLLEEMRVLAGRIEVLAGDQEVMAKAHVTAREEKDRDLFQVAEYRGVCDRYSHMLEQLRDYIQGELVVADKLDGYVDLMKQKHLERPTDDLTPLRERELEDLYKYYKEFVYCSGDLVTKKQHRMDVLERQTRFAHHTRESVKDCLDPNAARYEADISELTKKMSQCETVIDSIHVQDDATEQLVRQPMADFESIVETKRGEDFVHPTIEFAEKAVDDRRAFVDKTLRFVEGEERAVEKKKAALESQKAEAEEEHQHHLMLSAQKKSAALSGGSP